MVRNCPPLQASDGGTVKVPLERLSEEDGTGWIEARRKEKRRQ